MIVPRRWSGLISAFLAFVSWGLAPVYWKQIHHLPADAILANRMTWCALFVGLLVTGRGEWKSVLQAWRSPRALGYGFLSGIVVAINWVLFIWAVNSNRVVETSLGYFLNPLVNILAGALFFHERLRLWQWVAVLFAATGVTYLTWHAGRLPWVSLSLCGSFALYAVLRKTSPLESISGLFLETLLMTGPALIYSWIILPHPLGVPHPSLHDWAFTIGSGVITALPLVWFAHAARSLPLSIVGFMQYLAPTITFLLGIFLYHEPFAHDRAVAFACIWAGLAVFTVESIQNRRASAPRKANDPAIIRS